MYLTAIKMKSKMFTKIGRATLQNKQLDAHSASKVHVSHLFLISTCCYLRCCSVNLKTCEIGSLREKQANKEWNKHKGHKLTRQNFSITRFTAKHSMCKMDDFLPGSCTLSLNVGFSPTESYIIQGQGKTHCCCSTYCTALSTDGCHENFLSLERHNSTRHNLFELAQAHRYLSTLEVKAEQRPGNLIIKQMLMQHANNINIVFYWLAVINPGLFHLDELN